jgi:hypothetical protein
MMIQHFGPTTGLTTKRRTRWLQGVADEIASLAAKGGGTLAGLQAHLNYRFGQVTPGDFGLVLDMLPGHCTERFK